eukprot:2378984-Prymnesium_polylepis.1
MLHALWVPMAVGTTPHELVQGPSTFSSISIRYVLARLRSCVDHARPAARGACGGHSVCAM